MRATIYARVSSSNLERQNTERQVKDLTEYAKHNNLSIVEVYEEHISGAKRNDERPVLTECLNYAIKNQIDVILFSELSRCDRAVWEVLDTIRTLKDNRINAYFQKEGLSLFTPDGRENLSCTHNQVKPNRLPASPAMTFLCVIPEHIISSFPSLPRESVSFASFPNLLRESVYFS